MLRLPSRRSAHLQTSGLLSSCLVQSVRSIANEYKGIVNSGHSSDNNGTSSASPPPPAIVHNDPIMPMDFSPHIEWFEYPKEVFDPKYPFTREESIRMTEESWESSMDEMASRYGMRLNMSTKASFWMAWGIIFFYSWQTMWGCYRGMGDEPGWQYFSAVVESQPNCPTIEDDDIYLDVWIQPQMRERNSRYDPFWNWKPVVKRDGAQTSWALPMVYHDVSEWKHMTSKY